LKIISHFFVALLVILLSFNLNAQGKIFFDVKTKMSEKAELSHIKIATELLLLDTDWANVTEYGEEYSLWIKNYQKSRDYNLFDVNLDIEIRTPSMWTDGRLLLSKHIEVSFATGYDDQRVNTHYELIKQKLSNLSEEMQMEAAEVSDRIIRELESMVWSLDY